VDAYRPLLPIIYLPVLLIKSLWQAPHPPPPPSRPSTPSPPPPPPFRFFDLLRELRDEIIGFAAVATDKIIRFGTLYFHGYELRSDRHVRRACYCKRERDTECVL